MSNLSFSIEDWELKNKMLRGVAVIQRALETSSTPQNTPYYDLIASIARENSLDFEQVSRQFMILYPHLRSILESEIKVVNSQTQEL